MTGKRNRRHMMTPVGRMMEVLRAERGQTLRDFAGSIKVSHGIISAIAYGHKRLTANVLDKLRRNAGLPEDDVARLEDLASSQRDDMLTPNFLVPADRLIRREAEEDVKEVWVLASVFLEESNDEWRDYVVQNLERNCRYVYFVPHAPKAEMIELCLRRALEEHKLQAMEVELNFVVVPTHLHPHFFQPTRVLWHLGEKPGILGAWAFAGHHTPVDKGMLMEQGSAHALRDEYSRILDRLHRSRFSFADDPLEFSLIERRLNPSSS